MCFLFVAADRAAGSLARIPSLLTVFGSVSGTGRDPFRRATSRGRIAASFANVGPSNTAPTWSAIAGSATISAFCKGGICD